MNMPLFAHLTKRNMRIASPKPHRIYRSQGYPQILLSTVSEIYQEVPYFRLELQALFLARLPILLVGSTEIFPLMFPWHIQIYNKMIPSGLIRHKFYFQRLPSVTTFSRADSINISIKA